MCPGASAGKMEGMFRKQSGARARGEVAYPVYTRPREGAVFAGVAAGLARHLGVDVFWVRLVLLGLTAAGGVGVLIYAGIWLASSRDAEPADAPPTRTRVPGLGWWGLILVALVLGSTMSVSIDGEGGFNFELAVPLVVVALGAVLAWQAYDRGVRGPAGVTSVVVGTGLVFVGVIVLLVGTSSDGFVQALTAVVFTLAGVAVIGVPAALRVSERLSTERAEKLAGEQRAAIAAHLHDSVLQTLALIQKNAADPETVSRLARSQERELRQWLFDTQEKQTLSVFGALERACGEVEDLFGLHLAPVTVGEDRPLSDVAQAAVLAAREACVNVAKHAGVDRADVYAELLGGRLEIFVRDRGRGFDPGRVPADRHGLADSVRGRVERVGGTATVRSRPGEGTEVRVAVELV